MSWLGCRWGGRGRDGEAERARRRRRPLRPPVRRGMRNRLASSIFQKSLVSVRLCTRGRASGRNAATCCLLLLDDDVIVVIVGDAVSGVVIVGIIGVGVVVAVVARADYGTSSRFIGWIVAREGVEGTRQGRRPGECDAWGTERHSNAFHYCEEYSHTESK